MRNKRIWCTIAIALTVMLLSAPLPVQAGLRFTTDNNGLYAHPGIATSQWLEAWITASPRSGYKVYVDNYYFVVDHYQYGLPGIWHILRTGQDLTTFEVTFSGSGITTQTIVIISGGRVRTSNIPGWMDVEVLINDPKGVEMTATLNVDKAFYMDASATMTVHTVGRGVWYLFGFIPIYAPFESTYSVSCSAYYEDTGFGRF
jgi:hypothetical protein